MSNIVYLITGASRSDGLGFAAIETLLAQDPLNHIIVGVRDPSTAVELQELASASNGRLVAVQQNPVDLDSVKASLNEIAGLPFVRDHGIDVLFLNAGLLIPHKFTASTISNKDLLASVEVNLFGPVNVVQTFLPLLRLGNQKKIFYTSSTLGSTKDVPNVGNPGGSVAYGVTKSASNHYFRRLSQELEGEAFTVVMYHPGFVATSMSREFMIENNIPESAAYTPEEGGKIAAGHLLAVGVKDTGRFIDDKGADVPW